MMDASEASVETTRNAKGGGSCRRLAEVPFASKRQYRLRLALSGGVDGTDIANVSRPGALSGWTDGVVKSRSGPLSLSAHANLTVVEATGTDELIPTLYVLPPINDVMLVLTACMSMGLRIRNVISFVVPISGTIRMMNTFRPG